MTVSRLHVTAFLGVAVAIWCILLWFSGVPLAKGSLAPFSTVVGVLVALGLLLEHVLWHEPWLQPWLVKRPDLRGTWQVELVSDWIDPSTGKPLQPIRAYMAVTQTLSRLQMHLMTKESESWFVASSIEPSLKNDGYRIAAVYTNEPLLHLRGNRSEIHYGALALDTHGASKCRPCALAGQYWTDRRTRGTMKLFARKDASYSRFDDAEIGFAAASTTA